MLVWVGLSGCTSWCPRGEPVRAAETEAAEPGPAPRYYAALLSRGPRWRPRASWDDDLVQRHRAHLARLNESGRLVRGGPFADDGGGLAVYRAATLEQARRLAESDPVVAEGILKAEVHEWKMLYGAP